MINLKKYPLVFLLLQCHVITLVACSSSSDGVLVSPETLEINQKVDSSNVVGELVGEVTTSSEEINVKIAGSNLPDNWLYFYYIIALEKKVDGEWVSMLRTEESSSHLLNDDATLWQYAYHKNGGVVTIPLSLETKKLCDKITLGEYRVCVFLHDRNLYIEFEVTE